MQVSAALIREARLRAGLTQVELAEKSGRDRAVIARWEQGGVQPSLETLLEILHACGYTLPLDLETYEPPHAPDRQQRLQLSPERRLDRMLDRLGKDADGE